MSPNGGIVDVRHPRDVNFSCSTWIAATPGLRSRTRDSRNPAGPQYLQTATRTSLTSCRHPSTCRAERNPSATSRRSSTASGGRSTAIPRTRVSSRTTPCIPTGRRRRRAMRSTWRTGAGPGPEPVSGVRRNCETFTACRKHAYRVLLNYQARARADFDGWEGLLRAVGRHLWRAIVRNCLRSFATALLFQPCGSSQQTRSSPCQQRRSSHKQPTSSHKQREQHHCGSSQQRGSSQIQQRSVLQSRRRFLPARENTCRTGSQGHR